MSHFEKAVVVVLKNEGGLVDHPNDPGGLTNFGISARWARLAGVEVDIRNLDRSGAVNLYLDYFWNAYNLEAIKNEEIAVKIFDTLVNAGPFQAFIFLQRALHSCGYSYIVIDGILGPVTLHAVNIGVFSGLLAAYRSEQAGFYRLLVAQDNSKRVFLKGWLSRAYDEVV